MSAILEPETRSGFTAPVEENVDCTGMDLCVEREDINFYNLAPNRLRVEVTVHNRGYTPSRPETMQLQFAAFGAFVPWTPLQKLQVPQIRAGQSTLVSADALIREDGTLVATDGGSQSTARDPSRETLRNLLLRRLGENSQTISKEMIHKLRDQLYLRANPDNLTIPGSAGLNLHKGRNMHWVGNINVLIGEVDVERHMARAFRIYPGAANRSVFFLGNKAGESHRFQLSGSGAWWPTELSQLGPSAFGSFAIGSKLSPDQGMEIEPDVWVSANPTPLSHGIPYGKIGVEIRPPEDATEGSINIEVCRKSDKRTAVVEFDFSKTAVGPGCYTVGGS